MQFLRNNQAGDRSGGIVAALLASLAAAYPILVYLGRDRVPLSVFVSAACLLLLVRAVLAPRGVIALFRLPLLLAALAIGALGLIDADVAAKAYPAVLSGLIGFAFAHSLYRPPSLVERFARIKKPTLASSDAHYCRAVSLVWAVWLFANALIAAVLAIWGSLSLWALWTGLVSYLVMGILFAGEIALRPWMMRRFSTAPTSSS